MTTWARIETAIVDDAVAARVAEIIGLADGLVPGKDIFTPDVVLVDISELAGVTTGWTYAGGQFSAPPAPSAAPPPTPDQLRTYANTKQDAALAQVWSFDVGTADTPLRLTTRLDSRGQAAMLQLMVWSIAYASDPSASEPYSNVDQTSATITPAQAQALALQAGKVKSASIATLNDVSAAIAAGTVTTQAQIDAAAWPTPQA